MLDNKTEKWLNELPERFLKYFDYTETVYIKSKDNITYFCPIHGYQTQKAEKHKHSKCGCPECGKEFQSRQKRELGKQVFFDNFKSKYGDHYDTSVIDYTKKNEPCIFFCNIHTKPFTDTPINAEKRHPCTICRSIERNKIQRKDEDVVRAQSKTKFKKIFEFDFTNYTNCHSEIGIKCPTHGWFTDKLSNHLTTKYGCPLCFEESPKTAWNRISVEDNITHLKTLYGEKYNFFTEDINTTDNKVRYYCKKHHNLKSTKLGHLRDGFACNQCGDEVMAEKLTGWYTVKRVERYKDKFIREQNNLYLINIKDDIYKIGLAKFPSSRICTIRKGSKCNTASYVHTRKINTYEAFYLEKYLHNHLKKFRFKWDFSWKGHTETFRLNPEQIDDVISIIEDYKIRGFHNE